MGFVQRDLFGEDLQKAVEFLVLNFYDKDESCLPSEAIFDFDKNGFVKE